MHPWGIICQFTVFPCLPRAGSNLDLTPHLARPYTGSVVFDSVVWKPLGARRLRLVLWLFFRMWLFARKANPIRLSFQ